MDNELMKCPKCNNEIAADVFYCPICGQKIKERPETMDFWHLTGLFLLSLLLPPLNISWSIKYIKSPSSKAKKMGWVSIILMLFSLTLATWWGVRWAQEVNKQVNKEMDRLLGFLITS